jgi:putative PIN family toxin of toxin-antitoxin system
MLNVVLDTNIILSIVSSYSPYCVVKEHLIKGTFGLFVTNDILLEYEEKLQENYSNETAILFTDFLYSLPNLHQVERKFQSELIEKDPDDNKFVDCAYAGNVNFLVTNDKHFDRIKSIEFPKLVILTIDEFLDVLK